MYPVPGVYQYSYPTFVDTPQLICVNFLTPDGQNAFVSYPHHPSRKAARLIPLSWFQSVVLVKLDSQPRLMDFLDFLFTGLSSCKCYEFQPDRQQARELETSTFVTKPIDVVRIIQTINQLRLH